MHALLKRTNSIYRQIKCNYSGKLLFTRSQHNIKKEMENVNSKNSKKICTDIVWMDLEMTGLDVNKDKILEVSCLITDQELNITSVGPCFAINYNHDVLNNMNEWCMSNHVKSGLVQMCLESKISPDQVEGLILKYLKANIPKGQCPLAGNSVYMDRLFIRKNWPNVDEYMHYRIIDVSTIKELAKRWNSDIYNKAPAKKLLHRSLEDIKDSIEELKYYKQNFFLSGLTTDT